jgi:hypothetical protein
MAYTRHGSLVLLILGASLVCSLRAATKSSDLVTCTDAMATETFEFDRGFLQQSEYARFGLIFCKARAAGPANVAVELSARGPLVVRFFDVPMVNTRQPHCNKPPMTSLMTGI